ncbi:MAG TPA: cyclic nucleotide-binding domain-containing protein [Planctomycetota bacterium]|nr:cyclic nucleotide-binding domain-containing protein [Planctomycetota bacterium]
MAKERTSLHFLKYTDNFKSYKPGELIFKENDPGLFMYCVKKGKVELRREGLLLETAEVGDIFGEMALIEHSTRSATASAATDCEVVPIDEERFMYLVQQTPYFALDVLRVMARRLRHSTKEIASVTGFIKL